MFSDRIWVTRKSRIYTEKRLKSWSNLSQILMIWYSFILVLLSIWNLLYNEQSINLILIYGSVGVLALSIFLSSQKFIERSLAIRNCYIKLDEIYLKLQKAENEQNSELIKQLENEYFGVLQNVENHTDYDYLCLRFSLRNDNKTTLPPFTRFDLFRYIWGILWRTLVVILSFLLPVIIGIIGYRIAHYVGIK